MMGGILISSVILKKVFKKRINFLTHEDHKNFIRNRYIADRFYF